MIDETEIGRSFPGTLTLEETAAPSKVARDRWGSVSSDATFPSSLHYRGREDSTASFIPQSLPTSKVLAHFGKVVEDTIEQEQNEIARKLVVEKRLAESDRHKEVLERVKARDDEIAARKNASPLGVVRRAIDRKLPKGLRRFEDPVPPPYPKLIDLARHFFPPRGQLRVEIFDFGDGRAERSQTTLAKIRNCWAQKPEWATVRWIHAPLGVGLLHSSVEDLFLNEGPTGRTKFEEAGTPGWPYLECEILNFRSRANFQDSRDAYLLLRDLDGPTTAELNATVLKDLEDSELIEDVKWRSRHVHSPISYWGLAASDMAWQLSEGLGRGLSGPHAGLKPVGRHIDQQILSRHPFYEQTQVVRSSFRCFHRNDGYLLTLAPPIGVNFLDKDLSEHIQEPVDSLSENTKASAIAAVFQQFAETGTRHWSSKTVEYLLIFIITEIAATPHSMRDGHSAPDIAIAYQSILQDLKRKRGDKWERHDAAVLVSDYTTCIDEISVIVQVLKNTMEFLKAAKRDICRLDMEEIEGREVDFGRPERRMNECMKIVGYNLTRLETMLSNLKDEMEALFQLRSIQQNELSISADRTGKAVLVLTSVAIIFLPLSFFTSYFGMNLKGIQNTSKTERYFWSICGSVSLSIVVVTLIYAFRRNVASWFRNKFLQDNGTTREHHNTPPYTTQRNSMSAHGLAAQNKCGEHYKKATGLHSVVSNCSNRSLGAQPENVIELRGQDLGAPRASCSEG